MIFAPLIISFLVFYYLYNGDKIYKLSNILNLKSFSDVYSNLISQWQQEDIPLLKKTSFINKNLFKCSILFK